jgi:hypothetical protein
MRFWPFRKRYTPALVKFASSLPTRDHLAIDQDDEPIDYAGLSKIGERIYHREWQKLFIAYGIK